MQDSDFSIDWHQFPDNKKKNTLETHAVHFPLQLQDTANGLQYSIDISGSPTSQLVMKPQWEGKVHGALY